MRTIGKIGKQRSIGADDMSIFTSMIWLCAMIGLHEWGHAIVAKRQGIYKFVGVHPFGRFYVQMTSILKSRWDYLAGIALSSLAFPLFWLLEPVIRLQWWWFFVFAFGIGIMDIICFALYTLIVKDFQERQTRGEPIKDIGVPLCFWSKKDA